MIPEAAGATPYGIFCLADEYLMAAKSISGSIYSSTHGPEKLLAYHACELFLKTYLRFHGETIQQLRNYGHNLGEMHKAAKIYGLDLPQRVLRQLEKSVLGNDYVRIRYLVHKVDGDMRLETVLAMTEGLRECVRLALDMNEFGAPQSKHWAGPEPDDYLEAAGRKPPNP